MDMSVKIAARLRENGFSVTLARRAIFEHMQGSGPLTIRELTRLAGAQADRSSIYRNIGLFERLGIIQRIRIGWKYKIELSAAYSHHHHHLNCTRCHMVIEFAENRDVESLIKEIAERRNFTPSDHIIEIRGLCSGCTKDLNQKTPAE